MGQVEGIERKGVSLGLTWEPDKWKCQIGLQNFLFCSMSS